MADYKHRDNKLRTDIYRLLDVNKVAPNDQGNDALMSFSQTLPTYICILSSKLDLWTDPDSKLSSNSEPMNNSFKNIQMPILMIFNLSSVIQLETASY